MGALHAYSAPRIYHFLAVFTISFHPSPYKISQCGLPALGICKKGNFTSFSPFKTKENFPTFTCSKKRKNACLVPPPHCCHLAVYDIQRERVNEAARERVHPRGNHASLGAGGSSYFPARSLLCDFERDSWMISKRVPGWGKPHGEGVTRLSGGRGSQHGPRSAGTGSTLNMQFLKSAKQKSNYYHIMLVEAPGEGTLHQLHYPERCSGSQNGKVCLTCGPWRQM